MIWINLEMEGHRSIGHLSQELYENHPISYKRGSEKAESETLLALLNKGCQKEHDKCVFEKKR